MEYKGLMCTEAAMGDIDHPTIIMYMYVIIIHGISLVWVL